MQREYNSKKACAVPYQAFVHGSIAAAADGEWQFTAAAHAMNLQP
jgi:hypothetical protein